QMSQVVFTGALRGAGDTRFVAISSLICITMIRPVLTYILCYPLQLGVIGAWLSLGLDQYLRLVLNYARFSNGKWHKIKI
ncbi:MAG: MATE family efflux transporter, partial [Oscillospiraceae bacterium]